MYCQWDACVVLVENSRRGAATRKPSCWDFHPQRSPECSEGQASLTACCESDNEERVWRIWDMDRQVQGAGKCPLPTWSESYRWSENLGAATPFYLHFSLERTPPFLARLNKYSLYVNHVHWHQEHNWEIQRWVRARHESPTRSLTVALCLWSSSIQLLECNLQSGLVTPSWNLQHAHWRAELQTP